MHKGADFVRSKSMIRLIIIILFLIPFLIASVPILFVGWIIARFNRQIVDICSFRIIQWVFKVILFLSGTKVIVIGEEHIPRDEAVLYVPNHLGIFDALITYIHCPGLTGYVAKDSLLKIPLLSHWMKRIYCLFLNRKDIKEGLKTILTGIDYIKSGISMCIFPEGTRNKTPEQGLLPFKEGSLKMAEKTGCAIIPVAISNTAAVFEDHLPKIRSCCVVLQYGEPIRIADLDKEQKKFLGAYTREKIQEMRQNHGELLASK